MEAKLRSLLRPGKAVRLLHDKNPRDRSSRILYIRGIVDGIYICAQWTGELWEYRCIRPYMFESFYSEGLLQPVYKQFPLRLQEDNLECLGK